MNGIQVDTWIKLESCEITCAIVDGMAELQFGGLLDGLTITATEAGLTALITRSTEAIDQIRRSQNHHAAL
jgi:hypothetical protein